MRRLTPTQVVVIGLDIARALDWVHSKGLVHQDVHGGNVLQTLDQSAWLLSDFGNAVPMLQPDGSSAVLPESM